MPARTPGAKRVPTALSPGEQQLKGLSKQKAPTGDHLQGKNDQSEILYLKCLQAKFQLVQIT